MGVITDFIVADKKHAKEICRMAVRERMQKFHSEEIRGLYHNEQMEKLFCVLEGTPFKKPKTYAEEAKFEAYMNKSYPLLFQESEDQGPWIYQLPDKLVQALAKAKRENLRQLAKNWMGTGALDSWKDARGRIAQESVLRAIEILHKLSEEAIEQKVSVLMWISL